MPQLTILIFSCLIILLNGCAPTANVRGFVPNPDAIEKIKPGLQNQDQVLGLLGSPTATATFEKDRWYYITRKTEKTVFDDPTLIESRTTMIEFDATGFVSKISTLSNDAIRDIDPVERTTPTKGRKFGILQQLLGNLGSGPPISR